MLIDEYKLRLMIRNYLIESIEESSNQTKNAKGMGLEYLYALLQPAVVAGADLPLKQIELPHHRVRDEELDLSLSTLKDKGSDIDKPDDIETDIYIADLEDYQQDDNDLRIFDR